MLVRGPPPGPVGAGGAPPRRHHRLGGSESWQTPEADVLEQVTEEREKELRKKVSRGREELTRAVLAKARRIAPQYGIELVDVRIKRLNDVESVREKVYARMIREIRSTACRRAQEIQGQAEPRPRGSTAAPTTRTRSSTTGT